ncbi:MAG: hydrogenase formation protein HypD [Peptococcaceae bacterium]
MLDKFQDASLGKKLIQKIIPLALAAREKLGHRPALMEVCGTHTMAIARCGIKNLLAEYLELRSGPGCPVCVTDQQDIDYMINLARLPGTVMATFGDMLRVPGSDSSLEREKARKAKVIIFYSPAEAVIYASAHPGQEVIFLGVGFETTAPSVALSMATAIGLGLKNYSVFSAHKLVPPVMRALLDDRDLHIDGFILPGHVSAIIGQKAFDFIAREYRIPTVIAGFEPIDILGAIYRLLKQLSQNEVKAENGYRRLVPLEGNIKAQQLLAAYFTSAAALWRGFGAVPASGLDIKDEYAFLDAKNKFALEVPAGQTPKGCKCGEVLKGKTNPPDCLLFARTCTPMQPVGPCMVSSEGACAAFYQYELNET